MVEEGQGRGFEISIEMNPFVLWYSDAQKTLKELVAITIQKAPREDRRGDFGKQRLCSWTYKGGWWCRMYDICQYYMLSSRDMFPLTHHGELE
jgi:hypothetical protein